MEILNVQYYLNLQKNENIDIKVFLMTSYMIIIKKLNHDTAFSKKKLNVLLK